AYSPVIAMNASGQTIVAWYEQPNYPTSDNIQAVAAIGPSTGNSWAIQVLRPAMSYSDRNPAVAIDGKGNAFVAWTEDNSNYYYEVWMRQYTAGGGWNSGAPFETSQTGHTYDQQVVVNASGDAIVSYIQITGA